MKLIALLTMSLALCLALPALLVQRRTRKKTEYQISSNRSASEKIVLIWGPVRSGKTLWLAAIAHFIGVRKGDLSTPLRSAFEALAEGDIPDKTLPDLKDVLDPDSDHEKFSITIDGIQYTFASTAGELPTALQDSGLVEGFDGVIEHLGIDSSIHMIDSAFLAGPDSEELFLRYIQKLQSDYKFGRFDFEGSTYTPLQYFVLLAAYTVFKMPPSQIRNIPGHVFNDISKLPADCSLEKKKGFFLSSTQCDSQSLRRILTLIKEIPKAAQRKRLEAGTQSSQLISRGREIGRNQKLFVVSHLDLWLSVGVSKDQLEARVRSWIQDIYGVAQPIIVSTETVNCKNNEKVASVVFEETDERKLTKQSQPFWLEIVNDGCKEAGHRIRQALIDSKQGDRRAVDRISNSQKQFSSPNTLVAEKAWRSVNTLPCIAICCLSAFAMGAPWFIGLACFVALSLIALLLPSEGFSWMASNNLIKFKNGETLDVRAEKLVQTPLSSMLDIGFIDGRIVGSVSALTRKFKLDVEPGQRPWETVCVLATAGSLILALYLALEG